MGLAEGFAGGLSFGLEAQRMRMLQEQRARELKMREAMHALQVQQVQEARTQRMGEAQQKMLEQQKNILKDTRDVKAANAFGATFAKANNIDPIKVAHDDGDGNYRFFIPDLAPQGGTTKVSKQEVVLNPRQEAFTKVKDTAALYNRELGISPESPQGKQIQDLWIKDPVYAEKVLDLMARRKMAEAQQANARRIAGMQAAAARARAKEDDPLARMLAAQGKLTPMTTRALDIQRQMRDQMSMGDRQDPYDPNKKIPWMRLKKGASGEQAKPLIDEYNQIQMSMSQIRRAAGLDVYEEPGGGAAAPPPGGAPAPSAPTETPRVRPITNPFELVERQIDFEKSRLNEMHQRRDLLGMRMKPADWRAIKAQKEKIAGLRKIAGNKEQLAEWASKKLAAEGLAAPEAPAAPVVLSTDAQAILDFLKKNPKRVGELANEDLPEPQKAEIRRRLGE